MLYSQIRLLFATILIKTGFKHIMWRATVFHVHTSKHRYSRSEVRQLRQTKMHHVDRHCTSRPAEGSKQHQGEIHINSYEIRTIHLNSVTLGADMLPSPTSRWGARSVEASSNTIYFLVKWTFCCRLWTNFRCKYMKKL